LRTIIKAVGAGLPNIGRETALAIMTDNLNYPDTETKGTSRDSLSKVESNDDDRDLERNIMFVLHFRFFLALNTSVVVALLTGASFLCLP
jgi:hypothetical protein